MEMKTQKKELPEIYTEMLKQKTVLEEMARELKQERAFQERKIDMDFSGEGIQTKRPLSTRISAIKKKYEKACLKLTKYLVMLLVVLCCFIGSTWYLGTNNKQTTSAVNGIQDAMLGIDPIRQAAVNGNKLQKYYFNIGMRQDYLLQECQGSQFKQSFPDVDYSLFGYNILRGYPLSVGHDPGFTYPIFFADYTEGRQTADCRYSVPYGLVVVPDVSCVTSFSSKTVQTSYEFSNLLSVSAVVSGGGWGAKFSASAGYKESSTEISNGESVYILSTANCNYYFSKLVKQSPPRFHDDFLKSIFKLNATNETEAYMEFINSYGTHFATEVTFGARFTYEHKMNSKAYQQQRENSVNVAVDASYSGAFSIGGGFNMDSSQREKASEFSKSVETKTITVGAPPPANGDAMTWASTVQTNPIPTSYKLSSIEKLFTENYMGHLGVDFQQIHKNIAINKKDYCQFLKKNGEIDSCEDLSPGIVLVNTKLSGHYDAIAAASMSVCIDYCLQHIHCEAITFCKTCLDSSPDRQTCFLYKYNAEKVIGGERQSSWESVIFIEKVKYRLEFTDTAMIGSTRGLEDPSKKNASADECYQHCVDDAHCTAYSHCDCPKKTDQCKLYSMNQVNGIEKEKEKKMEKEPGTSTVFLSTNHRIRTRSTPTTTPTFINYTRHSD